ncbi:MAG: hypothetical protein LBE36_13330 [Flavobacteriaceae bacterium]|jgi:hypothetical protein|nr:hypothetical protein [Flavobacteriaceae bacterium]
MEIKKLQEYTDRELLELAISNQVRIEQRLFKIYGFLSEKYGEAFHKHNEHKGEAFKEFISSFSGLNQQIAEIIKQD